MSTFGMSHKAQKDEYTKFWLVLTNPHHDAPQVLHASPTKTFIVGGIYSHLFAATNN